MFKKTAVSRNCSWTTSGGWSFFFCRGLISQAGDLVAQGDKFFGHRLEVPVILHVLLDLDGLVLGDALGALFAVKKTLEDVIRTLRSRTGRVGFEELFAQGTTPEAVDGFHLLKQCLSVFEERSELGFHGRIVSL